LSCSVLITKNHKTNPPRTEFEQTFSLTLLYFNQTLIIAFPFWPDALYTPYRTPSWLAVFCVWMPWHLIWFEIDLPRPPVYSIFFVPPRCTVKRLLWFPLHIYFCPTSASWSDHHLFVFYRFSHITQQQQPDIRHALILRPLCFSVICHLLKSSLAQYLALSFATFYDFWSLFPRVYTLHVYRYTSTNRTHLIVKN